MDGTSDAPPTLRCSFCNKSQRDVKKLIAGPAVYICDECVDICLDIVAEDRTDDSRPEEPPPELPGTVAYPVRSAALIVTTCSLCHMSTPVEHALHIHSRGALCPGCIGAIEAAIAASDDDGEPVSD